MPEYKEKTNFTQAEADVLENQNPDCTWATVTVKSKVMYFAFKPFSKNVYYASIDIYNATKNIGNRNMTMTTGHLINGIDEYLNNDKVAIALDLYAQSMLEELEVEFKKKPTFTI